MTEQEALKWWREQDREAMDDVFLPPFIAIMDAYAAEHPADDDEPITAEWLSGLADQSSGDGRVFSIGVGIPGISWITVEVVCVAESHCDVRLFRLSQVSHWPLPLYTRVQLRRLIQALEG